MPDPLFIDLDGTLTDPKDGITRCIQYALDTLGEEVPPTEALTQYIGPPLLDTFATLVGDARAERALALYRERFVDVGWRENRRYPGIREALGALAGNGARLYVATSKPRVFAERIVAHFELDTHLDGVFGSELDGRLTDKSELLAHVLEATGGKRSGTMIGDRRHDIAGAKANGLRAIGVTWGYGSVDELTAAGADILVAAPAELPAVLGKNQPA